MRNLSYENEFDLHLNELESKTQFHVKGFRTWTRFETEVKRTRKMAHRSVFYMTRVV